MKFISLTQYKFSIVDDEDYNNLNQFKWYASKGKRNKFYARRKVWIDGKQISIFMHRAIMGNPTNKEIDHINGDGLDNRKCNLRICSRSENSKNCFKHKNNTSGLNGVDFVKKTKRWRARIIKDYKEIIIGYFDSKDDAGHAVDLEAIKLFGDFATLNFPEDINKPWKYPNPKKYKLHKRNKSGFRGVSWHKANKKWIAVISKNGKQMHIGCFNSREDASNAYDKMALKLFGKIRL